MKITKENTSNSAANNWKQQPRQCINALRNTTAKYAQMIKNLQDEVNKYGYYKFSHATRQKN